MILNAYAVLDAFIDMLRMLAGIVVAVLAMAAWRHWSGPVSAEHQKTLEDRYYLLFLLALLLLGLNVASWPLLYLLLQSYVAEWPGQVMCIYGVTRIGLGCLGPSRFLPGLLTLLQIMKPALVFLSGAWFVLYLINRRTRTAPLTGRVLLVLLVMGVLAACDAGLEAAYLVIPKREEYPSAGCCAEAFDSSARTSKFLPERILGPAYDGKLKAIYIAINGGMILALLGYGCQRHPNRFWLAPLLLGAVIAVPVSAVFLVEIAAPAILHLPYHHCPYDLIPDAPEAVLGVALFVCGSLAVGWACVAGWLGHSPETAPFLGGVVRQCLLLAAFGYLFSLVMMFAELALA
jgi:hypothetical protein